MNGEAPDGGAEATGLSYASNRQAAASVAEYAASVDKKARATASAREALDWMIAVKALERSVNTSEMYLWSRDQSSVRLEGEGGGGRDDVPESGVHCSFQ